MLIDLKANGKGEYTIMVSHSDGDGIGSVVLGKARFGASFNWYCCEYGNVNERVNEIIDYIEDNDLNPGEVTFFITDISVDQATAERLHVYATQDMGIHLYDHHPSAAWLNSYVWAEVVHDGSHCGTSLFFAREIVPYSAAITKKYEDYVNYVKDYDLWIHKFPGSVRVNRLLGLLKRDTMIKRFSVNPSVELTCMEEIIVDLDEKNEEKYYAKLSKAVRIQYDYEGRKYGLVLCDQYISTIGNRLVNEFRLDYVALLDIHGSKVSLRSNKTDVSEIAQQFGGGGHKLASGFRYSYDDMLKAFAGDFTEEQYAGA